MLTPEFLKTVKEIPGWLSGREGRLLYELAKQLGKRGNIVEIGSFQGKSTAYLAFGAKEVGAGRVISIDPHLGETHIDKQGPKFGETFSKFKKNMEKLRLTDQVTVIRQTSKKASQGWKGQIAVLNVDGLHEYEYAKEDLTIWLPHLISGGVVVCHDAFSPYPEVFRAVREKMFQSGKFSWIGVSDSQIFAVSGRPKNVLEKINLWRSVFFITLAGNIWHSKVIPPPLADFLVKRVLKIFYINEMMVRLFFIKD